MAYADYYLCDICRSKTFYDVGLDYEKPDEKHNHQWWLRGVGDMVVICESCAETHEIKIFEKEK